MTDLATIFGHQDHVTAAQECARTVLIFAYGWAVVRVAGRRVFGKWAALDIIVSIIIGSSLSRAVTGGAPLWGTLAATTLMLALHAGLAQLAARSGALSRLIEGRPVRLVEEGVPQPAAMRRWSISESDLREAVRKAGRCGLDEVRDATLEPSGAITIRARASERSD
jgi:uncharacterized membrane protein YcaP (DUF421 family)